MNNRRKQDSEKVTFRTMMKDANYMKLFLASVITRFGDSIDSVAYAYMVYAMTGSAVLMATLFAVNGIPSLIFNMISGVAVGYMPKKRVVVLMDFLRGLVVMLTAWLYFVGMLEVWHLYVFTILNSTFEAFRAPAASILYRLVVSEDKLEHAMSLSSSARTFAELVGFAVAAFLIGIIGVSGAILVDGVTFILCGLIMMTLVVGKEVLSKDKLTLKTYIRDLKEGIAYVFSNKLIINLVLFAGGLMLFFSPFNALQTPYVLDSMALDVAGISVMSIAFMVAMIVGSLSIPYFSKKFGYRKMFIGGGMVIGIGYFLFGTIVFFKGTWMGYVALGLVSLIMGSTIAFINVPINVSIMKRVELNKLARVSALVSVLALSANPIGGAIVGGLVSFMEISTLFYVSGAVIVLLFFFQSFNKVMYELDDQGAKDQVVKEDDAIVTNGQASGESALS